MAVILDYDSKIDISKRRCKRCGIVLNAVPANGYCPKCDTWWKAQKGK